MVSFTMQNILNLIRSHLFISGFLPIILGNRTKKNIAVIYVRGFYPCSPLGVLRCSVSHLDLNHFDCIFVYDVREYPDFILSGEAAQSSQHCFLASSSSLCCLLCLSCCSCLATHVWTHFWAFCESARICSTVSVPGQCQLDLHTVWIQGLWFLQLHIFIKIFLAIVLCFCTNLSICSVFWKMPLVIWSELHCLG